MTDCPVLIASSDLEHRQALRAIFQELGLDPICASSLKETQETLAAMPISIVFCEGRLSDGSFRELLVAARNTDPNILVIIASHMENGEEYRDAMRLGVFDVIPFPCHPTDVDWAVIRAMRQWRQKRFLAMTA